MRYIIYSTAFFSDNVLPMYKAMIEKGEDVTCLFHLTRPCSSLFESKDLKKVYGTLHAIDFKDIAVFSKFVDLTKVYVENTPYERPYSFNFFKSVIRIINFIRKGKFDYIHTDVIYIGWQCLLYIFRKKTILVVHEPIIHARKMPASLEFFRFTSFKFIPKLVVLNKTRKEEFCEKYNINPVRVLDNKLGPLNCMCIYKNEGIIKKNNQILYWGRIAPYKGIEYLCEAMLEVHKTIPEAKVVIAGSGNYYFDKNSYEELPYFTFINRFVSLEELSVLIQESVVTVCPYINTSQSGGVLSSFAMNCPVIASDVPAMREMIDNGETGLLFESQNSDALAKAIIKYLKDENLQEHMRNKIKESYESGENSWSSIVDRYLDFYERKI